MDSDDDDDDDDDQDATAFGEEEDTGYDLFPNDRRSSRTFQTSRNSKLPSAKGFTLYFPPDEVKIDDVFWVFFFIFFIG